MAKHACRNSLQEWHWGLVWRARHCGHESSNTLLIVAIENLLNSCSQLHDSAWEVLVRLPPVGSRNWRCVLLRSARKRTHVLLRDTRSAADSGRRWRASLRGLPPPPSAWRRLHAFPMAGGGLGLARRPGGRLGPPPFAAPFSHNAFLLKRVLFCEITACCFKQYACQQG